MARRDGFTLVEVALAVAIGIAIMAATVYAYTSMQSEARYSQWKTMVGTIQTNIAMQKFRTGTAPTLAVVESNTDNLGKAFWPGTSGALPTDPIYNSNTVTQFDSTQAPVTITGSTQTDNPYFNTTTTRGGWLYDPNTGSFRANLSNADDVEHKPSTW